MPKLKNRIGHKYGEWMVVASSGIRRNRQVHWECLCSCGTRRVVNGNSMRDGKSKSCGCRGAGWTPNTKKHKPGSTRHKMYARWSSLLHRCFDPINHAYRNYGGRGVTVCAFLREGPDSIEKTLGECPPGLSIDRIHNDGHYSCGKCEQCVANGWPLNLRWASQGQQCRNKRNTLLVTVGGTTKPLKQWAEEYGVKYLMVYKRLKYYGWPIGKELFSPSRLDI